MKNARLLLTAILASSMLFVSCEKDDSKTQSPTEITTKASFVGMGQKHNDALAAIYNELVQNPNLTKDEMTSIGNRVGANFLTDSGLSNSFYDPTFVKNTQVTDFTSATELYNNLSPELTAELKILETTLDKYVDAERISEFLPYTRGIINNVPQTLRTEQDRLAWQHAVDVMGYSSDYWSRNVLDWLKLNPEFDESVLYTARGFWGKLWDFIKPTVKADGVGAATGAVGGFFTGGPAGAGAGALGGGLGASAGNIVTRVWDWIF